MYSSAGKKRFSLTGSVAVFLRRVRLLLVSSLSVEVIVKIELGLPPTDFIAQVRPATAEVDLKSINVQLQYSTVDRHANLRMDNAIKQRPLTNTKYGMCEDFC